MIGEMVAGMLVQGRHKIIKWIEEDLLLKIGMYYFSQMVEINDILSNKSSNPGLGLGQAQECGRGKPVNGIWTTFVMLPE